MGKAFPLLAVALALALLWIAIGARWRSGAAVAPSFGDGVGEAAELARPSPDDTRPEPPHREPEARLAVEPSADDDEDEGRIPLDNPCVEWVRVRVTNTRGEPIAGARLATLPPWPRAAATTDADGWARMPSRVDAGCTILVEVAAEGYFHYRNQRYAFEESEVVLSAAGTLTGVVRDAQTGAPLPGARLTAFHWSCARGCEHAASVSDAAGRYELGPVRSGGVARVLVECDGYPRILREIPFPPDAGPAQVADLALERGRAVTGRVVDLDTALPVAGAAVDLEGGSAVTDVDGAFELFARTDREMVSGRAERAGYARLAIDLPASEVSRAALELPLVPLVPVSGRVVDANGTPLAGAQVSIDQRASSLADAPPLAGLAGGFAVSHDAGTLTRADGSFASLGLVAWRAAGNVRVWARGRARLELALEGLALPGQPRELELVLADGFPPSGRIVGRVTCNGRPASDLEDSLGYLGLTLSWEGPARSGEAALDLYEPTYHLDVEPGDVRLRAQLTAFRESAEATAHLSVLVPPDGDARADLELAFEELSISGTVRSADGSPVPDRHVLATTQVRRPLYEDYTAPVLQPLRARTGPDGEYALRVPVALSPYVVSTWGGWRRHDHPPVEAGATGVDFVLEVPGTLRVRAVEAATGSAVQAFIEGCSSDGHFSGPAGDWTSFELAPGEWKICAYSEGSGVALAEPVQVVSGEHVDLELSLPRGVRVELRWSDAADMGEGCLVEASAASALSAFPETTETDCRADGLHAGADLHRFVHGPEPCTVAGVPPGRYRLVARDPDVRYSPAEIDVPDVESAVLDVRVERTP